MTENNKRVEVSHRIEAPAGVIFEILANPQRHKDFDGSRMIRSMDQWEQCRARVHDRQFDEARNNKY